MTSADMLRRNANLIRNREKERREADPLAQLLVQLIARIGEPATVERAVSRPWASALFEGRRHVILLRVAGGGLRARQEALACQALRSRPCVHRAPSLRLSSTRSTWSATVRCQLPASCARSPRPV